MIYILDTNVVLSNIIKPKFKRFFEENYLYYDEHEFVISVATEGELQSLAIQRGWGRSKIDDLNQTINGYAVYPIKVKDIIFAYSKIDAYSQNKLPEKLLPKGLTARNMGKNDIWIAATAHVLDATLVTTDKDFDHLDKVYFSRDYIDITNFK